jgi:hypothetical protein
MVATLDRHHRRFYQLLNSGSGSGGPREQVQAMASAADLISDNY